jgi:beta-glucosidase
LSNVTLYNTLDPEIEKRVDELLAQMTLPEKVGQLVQKSPFAIVDWDAIMRKQAQAEAQGQPFSYHEAVTSEFEAQIREGRTGTIMCDNPQLINYLQRLAMDSRLHIPLLVAADVIHGYRTTFPIPLAQACTWNPELVERAERIAAEEASTRGINWIFAPMVDIARDPRWGRIAEGSGEDPYLGSRLAEARVRGFQSANVETGRRVAACPKHYVAYGAAEGGRDYNTTDFSERTLRNIYLPPFKSAFGAGAGSTMSAFNDIGGIPASANSFALRTILRDEWQWPGVVISDNNAVGELVNHGVAADLKDAARLAILAGVDIDMESGAYTNHLAELVEEGVVPLAVVDEAARRVLRLKFSLGLFEHPFTDEKLSTQIILRDDFRAHALEMARQSMVLLKNESGLLPLQQDNVRVAVIGPLADNRGDLLGSWASAGCAEDVDTILQGIKTFLPGSAVDFVQGCSLYGTEVEDFSRAVAAAHNVDVLILAVGEGADLSGEAHSRVHLGLPGRQQELTDALATTGKPIVAVLLTGRPLVVPRLAMQVDALLVAWHGGIRTGQAVADLLFGACNPSGKLAISWPRAEGQIPVYYGHKPTGRPADGKGTAQFHESFRSTYLDEPNSPLFQFGFGLSYTRFKYSDLKVETPSVSMEGTLMVSAEVRNTGARAGTEIAQLYVRDVVASVTRPIKELKGFTRLALQPGATRRVRFEVPASELGFIGPELRYIVEPGKFKVWIGPDSCRGLAGEFEIQP